MPHVKIEIMAFQHNFDPSAYPSACRRWLEGDRLCDLGARTPCLELRDELSRLTAENLLAGQLIVDRDAADACLAGILLLQDFLEESHRISQTISTATGSYWHGIMHRREPDYSNAKHWFHRVGDHPIFKRLGRVAVEMTGERARSEAASSLRLKTTWDPFTFVDLCQAVRRGRTEISDVCREIARVEWELLFDYSYRKAIGQP
jgi:hypothetical protein